MAFKVTDEMFDSILGRINEVEQLASSIEAECGALRSHLGYARRTGITMMIEANAVVLNEAQQRTLTASFDPETPGGLGGKDAEFIGLQEFHVFVAEGSLVINGLVLMKDGNWMANTEFDQPAASRLTLTTEQKGALAFYFSPENPHKDPDEEGNRPFHIVVMDGELAVEDAWLHPDGEWGTEPYRGSKREQEDIAHPAALASS